MKRLSASKIERLPRIVNARTRLTSDGLTLPFDACPRVRINIIVTTIVINMTTVAPKLRDNSLLMDD